jgi:hypothetical protein
VSTSGSVAGASQVGNTDRSFSELFWHVFDSVGYDRDWLNSDICYIFELCHRDNRIVVDYKEPKLPLLAVRDRSQNFKELDVEQFANETGFKPIESYAISESNLTNFVNSRGADHEGLIVFDGQNRIKVKSEIYVQLHKVRGNGQPDFSELFLNGDLEEFLSYFPEYATDFNSNVQRLQQMGEIVGATVKQGADMGQKQFAQWVVPLFPNLSGAMFGIRSGKYENFQQFISSIRPQQLDRLLDIG